MPTKRKPLNRRHHRTITPEVVEAFQRAEGHAPKRNDSPSEEYLEAFHTLHRALGVRPWETSPLDVDDEEPPSWMLGDQRRCDDWRKAQELRREILKGLSL